MELPLRGQGIFVTQDISSNKVGRAAENDETYLDNSSDSSTCDPEVVRRIFRMRAALERLRRLLR